MYANPLESQLERLARTLTEQFGVTVVCRGEGAWTDGNQIVLPSLPEPMSDDLERMIVGFLDHEMGHVAFSDFQVAGEFNRKHPGFDGLLNVIEDALVERRAMQRWPGVRANLDSMFSQIRSRIVEKLSKRNAFDRFCTAVYLWLSHHRDMLGQEGELVGYQDLLDGFAGVHNTRDASTLAEAILDRWLSRQQRCKVSRSASAQGEPRQGDGQRDGSPEPAGQRTGPSASGSGAGGQPGGDQSPDQGAQDPDAGSQGKLESSGEPGTSKKPKSSARRKPAPDRSEKAVPDSDNSQQRPVRCAGGRGGNTVIGEVLAEAIAESVNESRLSGEYRVFTKQFDRIDLLPTAADSHVQALLKTGTDTVRRLRRGLTNALRSSEKRWWHDDQIRGELSPRTLHRLCLDRPSVDVFRIRSMVQGKSTAVCIVLDISGSMTTRKMEVARDAMRVLLEALGDLKIPTEAFTFTTGQRFNVVQAGQETGRDGADLKQRYNRLSNLEIGIIKRYGESAREGLRRLPCIQGTGLTPLGEAMHIGATRLVVRPEFRKIMLVLTDGKAGCEGSSEAACAHAWHVARLIQKAGIELVGVGIQDDSLRAIVADTIVVHELKDLPAQLCKLLGRTLKKGLRHVG